MTISFGQFVRNRRLALNYGLREFARVVDLSPTFISKMEVGDFKPPKEENIIKIANKLAVNSDYLLALAGMISSNKKAEIIDKILNS